MDTLKAMQWLADAEEALGRHREARQAMGSPCTNRCHWVRSRNEAYKAYTHKPHASLR